MEGHATDFTEIAITVRDLDRELLYSQDKIGKLAQGMVVHCGGGWCCAPAYRCVQRATWFTFEGSF